MASTSIQVTYIFILQPKMFDILLMETVSEASLWLLLQVVPRCEFGLCAMNGELYAVGGWVGEDIGGSIERYKSLVRLYK